MSFDEYLTAVGVGYLLGLGTVFAIVLVRQWRDNRRRPDVRRAIERSRRWR